MENGTRTSWWTLAALAALAMLGCGPYPVRIDVPASIRHDRHVEVATDWEYLLWQYAPAVHFGVDESQVAAGDRTALERVVPELESYLKHDRKLMFVIEGHTDDSRSGKAGLELGRRRAEAVRKILVGAGLPAERLRTASVGGKEPLYLGGDDLSREKNRRVQLRAVRLVGDRS